MNYDEKIQNLQAQSQAANRDVIIQDRLLGQTRERVAEIQGRINMLVELKAEEKPKEKVIGKATKKKK
ncbi:hypothetical protein ES703_88846 [subsurface metagenome]